MVMLAISHSTETICGPTMHAKVAAENDAVAAVSEQRAVGRGLA